MNDPEQEPLDPRDPLWRLLGSARQTDASPFFARNVLREIRRDGDRRGALSGFFARFRLHRSLALAGACAFAAVALVLLLPRDGGDASLAAALPPSPEAFHERFDPASEMVAIEYLGQLMAVADPGQLDDDALADLFF